MFCLGFKGFVFVFGCVSLLLLNNYRCRYECLSEAKVVPKKLSARTLKARVKEEKETAKMYRKEGFTKQASQELQHAKFFEQQLKKK